MTRLAIDGERLIGRLRKLGAVGRDAAGRLVRLAASDTDKLGRDMVCAWLEVASLDVAVDRIGNIFGIWTGTVAPDAAPLLLGSHIDTVIDAGIYDGCYGVLAGLEVIETLRAAGFEPSRPVAVAAFTNEEGVRYAPDMMGSLVHAGGLAVDAALATVGTDGTVLGEELARIGYAGPHEPGFLAPRAYVELHIEQGPVLERDCIAIGAVETLQGISWQKVTIDGTANHAGTTPMALRRDAGHAAARVVTFLRDRATASNTPTVATVGCMAFEPNAINVIPSRATFTVDLRDPDEDRLRDEEAALAAFLDKLARDEGVAVTTERLARFEPVAFDQGIVRAVEVSARARGHTVRRMTSGAGHDAQNVAKFSVAPVAPALKALTEKIIDATDHHDAIRDTVQGEMRGIEGVWEFRVQLCRDIERQPVEDPTVEWKEDEAPFQRVATIRVAPQDSWKPDQVEAVDERMRFGVWTGIAAHQPLGNINRARNEPYRHSAGFRQTVNKCPIHEPSNQ